MTPNGKALLQMRNFPKAWMANSESIEAKLRRGKPRVAVKSLMRATHSLYMAFRVPLYPMI